MPGPETKQDTDAPAAPLATQTVESREKEENKQTFFYPGDAKTPSISVRAASQEKADELYQAKLKEIK